MSVVGRDRPVLQAAADKIENITGKLPHVIEADLSDPLAPDAIFRAVVAQHKRLDILVNNAGILADGVIGTFTLEKIETTLRINTVSAMQLMQLGARLMMRKGGGSMINTTSIMATNGAEGQFAYASAKAALIGATKSAARELGPNGIRVNCIAPGLIDTDMIAGLDDHVREKRRQQIALKREGTPEEVAKLTLFLASDMSSYINGQVVAVDGMMAL